MSITSTVSVSSSPSSKNFLSSQTQALSNNSNVMNRLITKNNNKIQRNSPFDRSLNEITRVKSPETEVIRIDTNNSENNYLDTIERDLNISKTED
jgi:hypothetical protein